ncbi:unnamed protein product, partial [Rotaria magnacalcarata]
GLQRQQQRDKTSTMMATTRAAGQTELFSMDMV